ncbi:MAG: AmpG family muropeptide MFS transporter [Bdellovibrionaceae bacterium]|nr:AmpG family muropeptide MFS transporter [Bdellovibrio sp.]
MSDAQIIDNRPLWKKVLNKKMLIIFVLGFASGLPLVLVGATLKQWLAQDKIDIKTIGFFSWVGLAYSFKYLWSPLLDRYFSEKIGRRKTWMLLSQWGLVAGICMMGAQNPVNNLVTLAGWAVFVAFMSATQDIAIDAYRREFLTNEEIGLGSSMGIYGYRIAMMVAGGVAVSFVADSEVLGNRISWNQLYFIMAGLMALCSLATFFVPEPERDIAPRTILEAVIEPFIEFFKRPGAWAIILFVFCYKLGDQIALSLLTPFYKDMGYLNAEIGVITKTFGLFSSLAGLFVGGLAIFKFGIRKCLWAFGILQGISTASFALVVYTGPQIWSLATTVLFEDFATGMGTAALTAYIATSTSRKFTATQLALLTSVATLGRTVFSGFSGVLQNTVGWASFFYIGGLLSLPGLALLYWLDKKQPQVDKARLIPKN